jgi:hypothetical protein
MDPSPTPSEGASTGLPGVQPAQPTWNDSFSQVDAAAEQLRVKLPLAPPGLLNGYMSVAPWLAMIFGGLFVLVGLVALVASTVLGPLVFLLGLGTAGFGLIFGALVLLVTAAIEFVAGWLMLQRRLNGWWLLAVGIVINVLSSLLHINVVGLIIWLLIAYVHLQVKPSYR